jgi:hypothetical protein
MRHFLQTALLVSVALLWLATTVPGQEPAPAREQLEMLTPPPASQTPEEQPDKTTAESADELGPIVVLKRAPQYRPLRVFSDTQYLYNSNVLLAPSREDADAVFVESLGASYAPRLFKSLASSVYVRQQFIRYDKLSRFDFNAQAAGLSLQRPVRNWFILSGGFDAERYLNARDSGKEFLKDFNLSLGIRRGQFLHERVFVYYGYQLNWLPTTPSDLTRLDNAVYAGVNVALLQHLTLQLAYRLRALAYYQDARFDYDHSLNASLIYKFNEYISARAFTTYASNTSDKTGYEYQGLTAGGGLGLSLQY